MAKYQHEKHVTIGKVILTGGGALMKGIMDLAGHSFSVPVVYGDAFARTEAPATLNPILKDAGPEFAVAVGLALRKL